MSRGKLHSQLESVDEKNGVFLVEKEKCLCYLCQFFSELRTVNQRCRSLALHKK